MIGFLKKRIIKSIRRKMVDTALPAFRKNKKLDNLKHNFSQINSLGEKNSDKKFYVIRINYGGGLFSIVLYVLSEIRYAESINAIPIVDMEYFISKYNEDKRIKKTYNSWEYYFKSISTFNLQEVYESKNVIINSGVPDKKMPRDWKSDPEIFNKFFSKYIKIRPEFYKISEKFYDKNFKNKKVLAVHFRGKGMYNTPGHPFTPTPKQIFSKVDEYLKRDFDKIFLVTAQQNYLDLFKKRYGNKVVYFNSFRTNTTKAFHFKNARLNHRYKMGRDILVEMLVLSKMKTLICSRSNVSQLASLISDNKEFEIYEIWNGFNTNNIILGLFLWDLKRILPEFLGGFKNKI